MIEMGKEYRTEQGERARIIATDAGGEYPIAVLVWTEKYETKAVRFYRADGKSAHHGYDLIEVKPRIKGEFWVVHFDDGSLLRYDEKPRTSIINGVSALSHHTYDCEEGEGLK